ncbi:MAG TPA: hypothetical protein VK775_21250 [Chthoniobacterales bacterium]|nr:hypothetical protein [Chthoniobacterales bacterium]
MHLSSRGAGPYFTRLGADRVATHVARVAIERDQQEISLREAQNELAHVNRVTTLGEFAASIAHGS